MSDVAHERSDLHALADGRLDDGRARAVEAHVAVCETCRLELAAIRAVTRAARRVSVEVAPPDLMPTLTRLLDAEDMSRHAAALTPFPPGAAGVPAVPTAPSRRTFARTAAAAGVLVALGGAAGLAQFIWGGDLVDEIDDEFRRYLVGSLRLDIAESDADALERRFSELGLPFSVRVFDFGTMDYKLAGGTVHRAGRRQSAMFGYRGPTGEDALCQVFPGRFESAAGGDLRENAGVRFFVHYRAGATLVFWQEGELLCSVASGALPDTVLQLAFSGAVTT